VWTVSTLSLCSFPTHVLPVLSVRKRLCILCVSRNSTTSLRVQILSLCAASQMWVRPRSPPEGGLEFRRDSRKRLCTIHVTVKNSFGFTLQDCNRVMEHTCFLLFTRSTSLEGCCSRIEREVRKIAECTSYTPCVLLSFSSPVSLPYSSRNLAL